MVWIKWKGKLSIESSNKWWIENLCAFLLSFLLLFSPYAKSNFQSWKKFVKLKYHVLLSQIYRPTHSDPDWNNTLIEETAFYFSFSYHSFDSSKISFFLVNSWIITRSFKCIYIGSLWLEKIIWLLIVLILLVPAVSHSKDSRLDIRKFNYYLPYSIWTASLWTFIWFLKEFLWFFFVFN